MTNQSPTIGIDVAKAHLDIHIHPTDRILHCANTKAGHKDMLAFFQEHQVPQAALAVLEASGGYERPVWICLQQAGYKVHLVQPMRARNFIRAGGTQAKTDKIDAQALALFGASLREAEKLEEALEDLIADHPGLATLVDLFCSMPGIGRYTAIILVAELPEIGQCSKAQIAALSGLAPYTRQSGAWSGKSHIAGGRKHVRKALYMAALSTVSYNPTLKSFYDRLRINGKSFKVAITATMRKMIVALNSMAKYNSPWTTKTA